MAARKHHSVFRQFDPDAGQPATERIDVRFLFDDDALYIASKMYDRLGAAGVKSTVVARDDFFNSDYFESSRRFS